MTAKKRVTPILEDAGKIVFELTYTESEKITPDWNSLYSEGKKKYTKLALEIWREVEKCI